MNFKMDKIKNTPISGGTSRIIGEEAHAGRQGDPGVDGAATGRRISAAREDASRQIQARKLQFIWKEDL